MVFIDYNKALHTTYHLKTFGELFAIGVPIPRHSVELIQGLYNDQ